MAGRNLPRLPELKYSDADKLQFLRQAHLDGSDAYYWHRGYLIEESYIFQKSRSSPMTVQVKLKSGKLGVYPVKNCSIPSSRSSVYSLIGVVGLEYWIAGKIMRKRLLQGSIAYEVDKISVFTMDQGQGKKLTTDLGELGEENALIVYC